MKKNKKIDMIMAYESGELKAEDTLKLFAELIRTGQIWSLQGHYSRTGSALIQDGFISSKGKILKELGE